jgi:hypothetical protein
MSLSSFFGGAAANASYQDKKYQDDLQSQQVALKEEEAGLQRNALDMSRAMALADQLGVSTKGGLGLDTKKLTEILQEGRTSNKFNQTAEELASLIANTDYTARKNEGFSFNGFSIGPENTLTMRGSYPGQDDPKMATTGGGAGAEEEVAFASVEEVANLLSNQYDQMWAMRANAGLYNQISQKQKLAGTFDQAEENRQTVTKAVADLTEQVDSFFSTSKDPAYSKASRKLKGLLAQPGLSPDEKLSILRDFGEQLNLPVGEIVTPEVEQAAASAQPTQGTAQPTQGTAQPTQGTAEPADNSAQIAELEARIAKIPVGRGGQKRKKELQKQIDTLKGEPEVGTKKVSSGGQMARNNQPNQGETDPTVAGLASRSEAAAAEPGESVVRATEEELSALKSALEAKNVTSLETLNKATRDEQIAILTVLSSASYVSPTQRDVYDKELKNVIETGTLSYDRKTLTEATQEQEKIETGKENAATSRIGAERLLAEFRYKVGGNVNTFVENQVDKIGKLFVDEDGDAQTPSVEQYYQVAGGSDGTLSKMFRRLMGARKRKDGSGAPGESRSIAQQEYNGLKDSLLAQISFGMQFVSQDGDLEWSLATDSGAPLTGSDATLSRIERDGSAEKGQPSGIRITKPGSSQTDGDAFTAEQVATFFGGNKEMMSFFFTALDEIKSGSR